MKFYNTFKCDGCGTVKVLGAESSDIKVTFCKVCNECTFHCNLFTVVSTSEKEENDNTNQSKTDEH